MKLNTPLEQHSLGMINADEARKLTANTVYDILIKKIEREILEHASRGCKRFISTTVLEGESLQFLHNHGYVACVNYDDTTEQPIGTFISWE